MGATITLKSQHVFASSFIQRFLINVLCRCVAASASDYVEVSNYMAVDRKMPRYCGQLKDLTMESDGPFFRVTFKSNDRFDGTGFFALYQFTPVADAIMTPRHRPSAAARQSPGSVWIILLAWFLFLRGC